MTKKDPKAFVTNEVLTETLNDVVDTILKGMDNMLEEQKKIFATKEDLNKLASKEDLANAKEELKTEISWVKDDIKGLTAELSGVPTRKEFDQLEGKVDKYLAS